ncbi:hypothetical protein N7510_006927 [Penicillium lagena]|uniref:uncharacterized protein n=1 Tax=Penicillium lagena TaxID=94218 RepID=UPI00253F9817|nr:uncharacterized protein N7510_006927 [Penicillium lagena]KAJ5610208.1 hypothetical protein N7510_006927 [Penicillium lagena]
MDGLAEIKNYLYETCSETVSATGVHDRDDPLNATPGCLRSRISWPWSGSVFYEYEARHLGVMLEHQSIISSWHCGATVLGNAQSSNFRSGCNNLHNIRPRAPW